jgi:uncharacterized protein (TIGR02246 family)
MIPRSAHRVVVPLVPWLVAGAMLCPGGVNEVGWGQALAQSSPASAEEKAIRAADDGFVADYNKGDSKALAARFTEDAEVVEHDGPRYQGRDLIEHRLAETFAASPGVKLAVDIEAIRFLSPDVAKEEGVSRVTSAQGASESRRYTVLYVKREGRWLLSSVREETDPLVRPHDRLKELQWIIGQWVDEAPDSVVHLTCQWSDDENFLIRTFTVRLQGKPVMHVTQRIGWDPLARQVRSWEFDSEGGFGEGRWSGGGDRWVVKHTGVRPDGTTASATNIMIRERADRVRWVSLDRVFGSEPTLDEESYVLVRVAPTPRLELNAAAPAPSSSSQPPSSRAPSPPSQPSPKRSPR